MSNDPQPDPELDQEPEETDDVIAPNPYEDGEIDTDTGEESR